MFGKEKRRETKKEKKKTAQHPNQPNPPRPASAQPKTFSPPKIGPAAQLAGPAFSSYLPSPHGPVPSSTWPMTSPTFLSSPPPALSRVPARPAPHAAPAQRAACRSARLACPARAHARFSSPRGSPGPLVSRPRTRSTARPAHLPAPTPSLIVMARWSAQSPPRPRRTTPASPQSRRDSRRDPFPRDPHTEARPALLNHRPNP